MLSEDLASLAALLRETPGMTIGPVTVAAIRAALDLAVRDAQALERPGGAPGGARHRALRQRGADDEVMTVTPPPSIVERRC